VYAFAAFNKPPNKEAARSFLFEILRFPDASREPKSRLATMRGITSGVVGNTSQPAIGGAVSEFI